MTKTPQNVPSALVIPFGKHKGATVAELLVKDPGYADWILAQGWVAERFAELHAALVTRGAGTDDTPEHNAIQARFLDRQFLVATLLAADRAQVTKRLTATRVEMIAGAQREVEEAERKITSVRSDAGWWTDEERLAARAMLPNLEQAARVAAERLACAQNDHIPVFARAQFEQQGIDVVISWNVNREPTLGSDDIEAKVEIKPALGDDFPSVMRQMSHLRARILVIGDYTGRGVNAVQLRQMFEANRQTLLFVRDIEAEMAAARDLMQMA